MSEPTVVCPRCGRRSSDPEEVELRYCRACQEFHEELLRQQRNRRRARQRGEHRRDGRVISQVYVGRNGMVLVFDQYGEQMPGYQGELAEVAALIREAGFPLARFQIAGEPPGDDAVG